MYRHNGPRPCPSLFAVIHTIIDSKLRMGINKDIRCLVSVTITKLSLLATIHH